MNLGVYIHFPFCIKKCGYCSFYSVPIYSYSQHERAFLLGAYIDRLLYELVQRSEGLSDYTVDTVYLGGGTPSLFSPQQIRRVLDCLNSYYNISKNSLEITIECNPGELAAERIEGYVSAGINRIVLGIQTLNSRLNGFIGRSSDICDGRLLDDFLGIKGVVHCVDLIAGIPGQTEDDQVSDLETVSKYCPEHISVYLLSIEKGTELNSRFKTSPEFDEHQRRMFELVMNRLHETGYRQYEISNFARPSFESRHNCKYWSFQPYAGFGASAHSFYGDERLYNTMSLDEYMTDEPVLIRDERNRADEMAEFIFTGLRLLQGFSLGEFEKRFKTSIPEETAKRIQVFYKDGLINVEKNGNDSLLLLTRNGIFVMDAIVYDLVEPFIN